MKQLLPRPCAGPGFRCATASSCEHDGDRITAVGSEIETDDHQKIDCQATILAPGIIDLGVFAIDKPAFHYGGVTRAALMPDQSPVLDLPAMIKHNASEGKPDLWSHPLQLQLKG